MKAGIVTSLRSQYDLKELLKSLRLPRATYYDRLKRNRKADKYAEVKAFIKKCFYDSKETYGYRRIHDEASKHGLHYAEETIRRLMGNMGLKVTIYSKHTSKYHFQVPFLQGQGWQSRPQYFEATVWRQASLHCAAHRCDPSSTL